MWEVLSDFDGTILKNDLPQLALKRFGRAGWERSDDTLPPRELSLEDSIRRFYAMIGAQSRKEITDYIHDSCEFRPGFDQLLRECRDRDIDFTIVSVGLDFCIEYAFAGAGIRLPRLVCPKSSLVPGKGFTLVFPKLHFPASRDFKEDRVDYYKKHGRSVVFVGDGMGDFNAASKADAVFAIKGSTLDEMCSERKIPHRAITTFAPVSRFISGL